MTPPGFPNDFPSPTVRHNPCSDPPCQHGTSKRLVGEGAPPLIEGAQGQPEKESGR